MPRLLIFGALVAMLGWPPVSRAEDPSPVAKDAQVVKLAGDFSFTEGPSADADGNVYFTDQPNDRILVWTTAGKLETFLQPSGRSNGLYVDRQNTLWACADENNQLWKIDLKTKEKTVVVKDYNGKLLNGPNDVWVHPQGGAYFTDPFYKRPYWKRGPQEQDARGVYHVSPEGKVTRLDADYKQPNGIIGTPDGKTLYVADIGDRKTYAYDVAQDGTLANRRLFCNSGSDGMTIDTEGNVYLTGKGVLVFNPQGKQIATINVPEGWTANVCFGGKDRKTLFITASKGLYAIAMRTAGVRP